MLTIDAYRSHSTPLRRAQCVCGHGFGAPDHKVTSAIACPKCGTESLLPLSAPRWAGAEPPPGLAEAALLIAEAKPDRGEKAALEMAYIAGACIVMLIVGMVATALMNG